MKIVYFIPHLRQSSGMERVLSIKANNFIRGGDEVTIITYSQFDNPIFFNFDPRIKFVHLNIPDPTFSLHQYSFFERRRKYKQFIETYRQKIEQYLMENPTDIAISMFLGVEHRFLPQIKDGSKKILEFHFSFDVSPFRLLKENFSVKNIRNWYHIYQLKKVIERYDKVVVLTETDAQDWKMYFSNIETIPNPITINPIKDPELKNKTAIAVGRLTSQKGFDYLVDAWKIVAQKHPDWKLNIFGSGELKEKLSQQILTSHLENHVILNAPTKEIEKAYHESSLFILSSRYEGFGLVLIEALASGLPCVSFDCKHGPKQMISDEQNGFLVSIGDTETLAEKIICLIENPSLRQEFSKKAIQASQKYSLENIINQWKELFQRIKR